MTEYIRGTGLIFGSDEYDMIWTDGPSIVFAEGGDDALQLGNYNDISYLGDGHDMVQAESGNDLIFGESGNDFIYGGGGNDWLDGGLDNDILWGGEGNDQLFGKEGNDMLYGVTGTNALYGSHGDDLIIGGDGTDIIFGGEDNDMIFGGGDNDWVSGGSGHNQVSGQDGDDIIYGSGTRDGRSNEFFYRGNDDNDTVNRFNAENDQFMIAANINGTDIDSVDDFASLLSSYGEAGSDDFGTVIDLGGGSSIQLVGVSVEMVSDNLADYITIIA